MTHAVIMAGGEGTRLRPFTRSIPKPLLPIGRKPVAQIIVERLRDCGISDIIMTLEYGADLIRAYFQDGSQFGVRISYFHEPRKMGTAGCLPHIPELKSAGRDGETVTAGGSAILVTNGDIVTDLDYTAMVREHETAGAAMTVATRNDSVAIPYGVLQIDGADGAKRVRGVEEKPSFNYCFNAGVYAISRAALAYIPSEEDAPAFPMTDLIGKLVTADQVVRAHPVEGLWFDLARVDDFEQALRALEETHPELLL